LQHVLCEFAEFVLDDQKIWHKICKIFVLGHIVSVLLRIKPLFSDDCMRVKLKLS